MDEEDPFKMLGVTYTATQEQIDQAFKTLVHKHHPDCNGNTPESNEAMARINVAYAQVRTFEARKTFIIAQMFRAKTPTKLPVETALKSFAQIVADATEGVDPDARLKAMGCGLAADLFVLWLKSRGEPKNHRDQQETKSRSRRRRRNHSHGPGGGRESARGGRQRDRS